MTVDNYMLKSLNLIKYETKEHETKAHVHSGELV